MTLVSHQVDGLTYELGDLEESVLYNFYVVAHNDNGAGQAAEEVTARTYSAGKYRAYCSTNH